MYSFQGDKQNAVQYLGDHLVAGCHGRPQYGIVFVEFYADFKYFCIGIGKLLTNIGYLEYLAGKFFLRKGIHAYLHRLTFLQLTDVNLIYIG